MAFKKTVKASPGKGRGRQGGSGGRGQQATITQPFDIIPGTRIDERFLPWALNLLVLPAAGLLLRGFVFKTLGSQLLGAVLIAAGFGFITWRILDEARPRGRHVRERLAAQFLWVALAVGSTLLLGAQRWQLIVVEFGGLLMATWWATAATTQVKGEGRDDHHQGDRLADELGWGRVTARVVEDAGDRRVVRLTHRDVTVEQIRDGLGVLAARLGLPKTGLRAIEGRDDSGVSEVVMVRRDVLDSPTLWPGPSAPGASIAVPSRVGVYEDGSPLEIVRPGAGERPSVHVLYAGMTGSGKTEAQLCELAEAVTRTDVVLFRADTRKAGQTLADIAPAYDWVATNRAEVRAMLRALKVAITARADWLGQHGYRQWEPGCGLPYLQADFDEGGDVAEEYGEEFTAIGETARSAALSMGLSMARASYGRMDTDTRAQFGIDWAFGARNADDAAMALRDETIEAGARPEQWANRKPGMCYLEASHQPLEKHAMPGRTFLLKPEILRRHIAEWAPRMATLDAVTARALGVAYTQRTSGIGYALQHGWTRTDTGVLIPPARKGDTGAAVPTGTASTATAPASSTVPGTVVDTAPGTAADTAGGTATVPATTWTEPAVPTAADSTDEDEETAELNDAIDDARAEVAAEYPITDPELAADARAAGNAGEPLDGFPPGEDFELWDGTPGQPLTRPEKIRALAEICDGLTTGDRRTVDTSDLVTAWLDVPGVTTRQRPALYELLGWLEREGQVEDPGKGKWTIQPSAGEWLRAHLAGPDLPEPDTDSDDDQVEDDADEPA